jgi:hypothetical protein
VAIARGCERRRPPPGRASLIRGYCALSQR